MEHKAFEKLKTNLELSPSMQEKISQKHNAVRSVLENSGSVASTKLIGSVGRKTAINPSQGEDFDIDILVVLGGFDHWVTSGGISASDAMDNLNGIVSSTQRYGAMNPSSDDPVVQFEYSDGIKVELVPAYLDNIGQSPNGIPHSPAGRAYWIPKNGIWELADYDHEAEYITNINVGIGGYLIPVIKMLKATKKLHFPKMSSFHLEILALENIPIIVNYRLQNNLSVAYPELIKDFFRLSKNDLLKTIKIPNSHSPVLSHSPSDALEHTIKFQEISNHCGLIDGQVSDTEKTKLWKALFGDPFPTEQSL
jgi:hypothetical protein